MNEIIKKIEAEQLKADAPEFRVGDTVRVHAKSYVKGFGRLVQYQGLI